MKEKPSPPGYWGNREDGYELHGLVRNISTPSTGTKTGVRWSLAEFDEFYVLSELIAELQSELPDDQSTSKRIQRVTMSAGTVAIRR